jgi:hypothetical protein
MRKAERLLSMSASISLRLPPYQKCGSECLSPVSLVVKRWRDSNMAERWAGAVLLELEGRFRRIQDDGQLLLISALCTILDKQDAVA